MRKVILQIELKASEATVPGVRRKLGLSARQIDPRFGVAAVRPERNLYAVRVDADVAETVRGEKKPAPQDTSDARVALVH